MNIFYTDHDPQIAAKNLCKIHINKMIIESAQILSTTQRLLGNVDERLYRITHKNHPSNIWVRQSSDHYLWVLEHMKAMMQLYTKNSGKIHGTEERCLEVLSELPANIKQSAWQLPPFCAVEDFKREVKLTDSVIQNYKNYLAWKYVSWQNRVKPLKVEFVK